MPRAHPEEVRNVRSTTRNIFRVFRTIEKSVVKGVDGYWDSSLSELL